MGIISNSATHSKPTLWLHISLLKHLHVYTCTQRICIFGIVHRLEILHICFMLMYKFLSYLMHRMVLTYSMWPVSLATLKWWTLY